VLYAHVIIINGGEAEQKKLFDHISAQRGARLAQSMGAASERLPFWNT